MICGDTDWFFYFLFCILLFFLLRIFYKKIQYGDQIRLGQTPFYGRAGAQNLFLTEVKDGQQRGSAGVTITFHFSIEDMLRSAFWKSERDKKRNRKRDFTWKHYNSYP